MYKNLTLLKINFLYYFLGFEYVNCRLTSLDKRLLIPLLTKYGAKVGRNCDIESPLVVNAKRDYSKLEIGNNVYIGKKVVLDIKGGLTIKDNVTISFGSTIVSHIDVGKSDLNTIYPTVYTETVIGNHCYLGANSIILNGTELGDFCLVAAGSVVTQSFPPNSVIAGIPAKKIKELSFS